MNKKHTRQSHLIMFHTKIEYITSTFFSRRLSVTGLSVSGAWKNILLVVGVLIRIQRGTATKRRARLM